MLSFAIKRLLHTVHRLSFDLDPVYFLLLICLPSDLLIPFPLDTTLISAIITSPPNLCIAVICRSQLSCSLEKFLRVHLDVSYISPSAAPP